MLSKNPKATPVRVAFVINAIHPAFRKVLGWWNARHLRAMGCKVQLIDVTHSNKAGVIDALAITSDAIYVDGGNTFRLMRDLRATGHDKTILFAIQKDILYVGMSAGSIITSPDLATARWFGDAPIKGAENYQGLNVVTFAIYPHAEESDHAKVSRLRKGYPNPVFLLRNGEALAYEGTTLGHVSPIRKKIETSR
jgi:peptidase E